MTQQVLREDGLRGMFRGFVPTIAREMPGYFFFFGGYEGSRRLLAGGKPEKDLSEPFLQFSVKNVSRSGVTVEFGTEFMKC